MVSRIPPPEDGHRVRQQRPTTVLAVLLVVAVAVGVWLLAGRDTGAGSSVVADGTGSSATAVPESDSAGAAAGDPEDGGDAEDEPDAAPPSAGIDPDSGLPTVYLLDLPPEAAETVEAVERGPPFAYEQDGGTFFNREGLLPDQDTGYYREFTVVTPGSSDRGARRIVEGARGELYWTDDHYASFARIVL